MEEVRISDWPEPPGSHAWLPAYGFQHELLEKDDYFATGECRFGNAFFVTVCCVDCKGAVLTESVTYLTLKRK
ncbi:unnamed protein product [Leptosia nina]|uniref:Uncharacterized protein n=1 Tax=Leptosia nina TaxID=320188 RepID=A0AAV1JG96_9NEOP